MSFWARVTTIGGRVKTQELTVMEQSTQAAQKSAMRYVKNLESAGDYVSSVELFRDVPLTPANCLAKRDLMATGCRGKRWKHEE